MRCIMKVFILFIFIFTSNIVMGQGALASSQVLEDIEREVDQKNRGGLTSLSVLSKIGNSPEAVQFLIDSGADLNEQADNGDTPLMQVVCYNNEPNAFKIAEVLIQAGSDLNVKDEGLGWTAAHCAARTAKWDMLLALLSEESFDLFVEANNGVFLWEWIALRLGILEDIQSAAKMLTDDEKSDQSQVNKTLKDSFINLVQEHISEKRKSFFEKNMPRMERNQKAGNVEDGSRQI